MYDLTINLQKSPFTVTIKKDGHSVTLTEDEMTSLKKMVDRECYYRSDVEGYFTESPQEAYDVGAVFADKKLMNEMVDYYTDLRYENNGGDPSQMKDWLECLDETIEHFRCELEKYLLSEDGD